jgi:hypothetical protein
MFAVDTTPCIFGGEEGRIDPCKVKMAALAVDAPLNYGFCGQATREDLLPGGYDASSNVFAQL